MSVNYKIYIKLFFKRKQKKCQKKNLQKKSSKKINTAINYCGQTPFAVLMKMLNMGDADAVLYLKLKSKNNLAKWKSGDKSPPQGVMQEMYGLFHRVRFRAHELAPNFTGEHGMPKPNLNLTVFLPLPEEYHTNDHDKLPDFAEDAAYISAVYLALLEYYRHDYDD